MKNGNTKISALLLAACLAVSGLGVARAQMPGGAAASGPIDITADEQEFAGDSVIARGRVRVVYKDSVILAPLATLYKDPAGNPNKAIFTGHPRLTQGASKIDANVLTFEMAINKIIAEGNAHSEVDVPEDEQKETEGLAPGATSKTATATSAPKANADEDEDEDDAPKKPVAAATKEPEKKKGGEKIITDSNRQEYDQATGKFDAYGHVKVVHGDIIVYADKLNLVYSASETNSKPETAIFTGNVIATQGKNTTCADNMNYSLSTKRLQATGHVKSKVIQEKSTTPPPKKKNADEEEPTAKIDSLGMAPAKASNNKGLAPASDRSSKTSIVASPEGPGGEKPVWVYSDAQDYSKDNGRMSANGNVKVVSGEMYGCGPAIVLIKKPDGRADKIIFKGRSQISQPGRRWIADKIIYIVDKHRVIANGNAKAMMLKTPEDATKEKLSPTSQPVAKPLDSRMAGQKQIISTTPQKQQVSASKIEATK